MQQFQPDSAPDTGNLDEQPLVLEDLPVEAAQHQTTTSRKSRLQLRWLSLMAGGILLLLAVVVGARLLPPAPGGHPSPGPSSRTAPPSNPSATAILTGGPAVSDHSVYPTVADGVVYVSTSANVTYALTGNTGTLLWRSTTQGATSVPPVVAHGIVYVTTHLSETASSIYALQANDGKMLWSQPGDNSLSLAQVADDIVYEASGAGIAAARASDGSTLWSYTTKGRDAPSVYGVSWVSDGVVYGSVAPYSNTGPSGSRTTLFAFVMATWVTRSKNRPFETEKELHPLLANTGGLVYNQTSSIASSCSNDETLT